MSPADHESPASARKQLPEDGDEAPYLSEYRQCRLLLAGTERSTMPEAILLVRGTVSVCAILFTYQDSANSS